MKLPDPIYIYNHMHALHGCCMTGGCKNYDSGDWEVGTIMIKRDGERERQMERERKRKREKKERERKRERERKEREIKILFLFY